MIEQEIKIPVPALDPVRARLHGLGALLERPLAFEDNLVLDDATGTLAGSGRLLRLRSWSGESVLTFKGPAHYEAGVKSRLERETAVANREELLAILDGLGFRPIRRYQKRREVWRIEQVVVALDETPLGAFVELEGQAAVLAPLARRLGLDPAGAVAGSYVALWEAHRARHPEAGRDMVFE